MLTLTLTRFAYSPNGTFGEISLNGITFYTVERPWIDNKPNISCIPAQDYICRRRKYNKGGYDTFEVTKVPGRSYILFHIANTMLDVKGCIGIGDNLGFIKGLWAVTSSRKKFTDFMNELTGVEEFTLKVRQITGTKDFLPAPLE